MQTYNSAQNTALLLLRIITAAIFYVATTSKFSFWSNPPADMSAFMVFTMRLLSIAEPLGATAILFGFLTRWAAWGLIIIMLGAIYILQFQFGVGFVTPTSAGWNMPLSVLGGCIILAAFGAGKWSVDGGRGKR